MFCLKCQLVPCQQWGNVQTFFLLYKVLCDLLISLGVPLTPSLTSTVLEPVFANAFYFIFLHRGYFFFWSASSPLRALSLPHLVMKVERKEHIWETFHRFQIYLLHNLLVYFAIQRESIHLLAICLHYGLENSVLYCNHFLMCFFLSWQEFISYSPSSQGTAFSAWHTLAGQKQVATELLNWTVLLCFELECSMDNRIPLVLRNQSIMPQAMSSAR